LVAAESETPPAPAIQQIHQANHQTHAMSWTRRHKPWIHRSSKVVSVITRNPTVPPALDR
jgi:hypothetical protein